MNNHSIPAKSLVGAWELASGTYVGEDQVVIDYLEAGITSLKVLSGSKFSFVTITKGTFYAAGAGDYVAENGHYIEIPALASHPEMVGNRYDFEFKLEDDTWENTRWQNDVCVEHEIWRRVQ